MATYHLPARLLLAGGFAAAVTAIPAVAALATPTHSAPLAQCPAGEEEDLYIGTCLPHTVPNSGSTFQSIPGNPDLPSVDGIPCTGGNSGQCIGLGEEQQAQGPQPVPRSTIGSSPTVTGSTG